MKNYSSFKNAEIFKKKNNEKNNEKNHYFIFNRNQPIIQYYKLKMTQYMQLQE